MVDTSIWKKYLELMNEIIGGDLRSKSRKCELVLGRSLVALQLRRNGYTLKEIGYVINRDHATVVHCIDVAKDRLATAVLRTKHHDAVLAASQRRVAAARLRVADRGGSTCRDELQPTADVFAR